MPALPSRALDALLPAIGSLCRKRIEYLRSDLTLDDVYDLWVPASYHGTLKAAAVLVNQYHYRHVSFKAHGVVQHQGGLLINVQIHNPLIETLNDTFNGAFLVPNTLD